jgi:hypothetical protein
MPLRNRTQPIRAQGCTVRQSAAMQNRAGISDRDRVIAPALSEFLGVHHATGGQCPPGGKRPVLILASGKHLDRRSADIEDQHPWDRRRPCALRSIWSSSPAEAGERSLRHSFCASYDSEVRLRACGQIGRTSESGLWMRELWPYGSTDLIKKELVWVAFL